MKISAVDKSSFEGIPFSNIKVKGSPSEYKLYNINHHDTNFLKQMYENINLRYLMPKMNDEDYTIWDEMLKSAIKSSNNSSKKVFIETCDNIPCGILNYSDLGKLLHLNYIVTYPIKQSKRVMCGGQILMNELLKRFIKSDAQKLELQALRESPFSPISMYRKLGFGSVGGDNYSEFMRINKERAVLALAKQDEFIMSTPIINPVEEDLLKTLNIKYE